MKNQYLKGIKMPVKKAVFFLTAAFFLTAVWAVPVLANNANVQIITNKFDIVKEIMAAVVTGIGILVTLWGIAEFGNALQTQEGGALSQALKRIGGGLVMILATQLLALLV